MFSQIGSVYAIYLLERTNWYVGNIDNYDKIDQIKLSSWVEMPKLKNIFWWSKGKLSLLIRKWSILDNGKSQHNFGHRDVSLNRVDVTNVTPIPLRNN